LVEVPDVKHHGNPDGGSSAVPRRPQTDIMRATVSFCNGFANICKNTILIFLLPNTCPLCINDIQEGVLSITHTACFPAA
jgi:hypothetical protein